MSRKTLEVSVDGRSMRDLDPRLDRIDVDLTMNRPSSLIVTWRTPSTDVAAKVGGIVEAAVVDEDGRVELFSGILVSIQVGYTDRGTTTTVVAQDPLYALSRGRRSQTWVNSTATDAALKVLKAIRPALKTDVRSTATVHDVIVQMEETDLEFLLRLAGEIGYSLWVDQGTVHFDRHDAPRGKGLIMESDDVLRLNVGENVSQQVSAVDVHYWDPQKKQAQTASRKVRKPSAADGALSRSVDHVVGWGSPTHAAAQDLADGLGLVVASAQKTMQAMVPGDGRIRTGVVVELAKIDPAVDGAYLVTRARHRFDPERGYEVDLDSAPYRDLALSGMTNGGPQSSRGGTVTALVTSIKDPQTQGRVQVELPWTDSGVTAWARVAMPGAGAKRGLNIMPEVGDEVFVVFEHGDARRPVVVGGAYNGKDRSATVTTKDESVLARTWYSRTGHNLVLDDDKAGAGVRIETSDGRNVVRLKEKDGAIEVIADKGGITLTSKTGDLVLKGKNVTIEASASATVKGGANVDVNAGAQLKLSGSAGGELTSPGVVQVKGSLLKLN